MAKRKLKHFDRRLSDDERVRHARIREAVLKEFPRQTSKKK